jgi:tetratricopeptide (TPR) repeat protein
LGEISNAQKHLSEALEYDPEDIKIRNASAEAFVAGLDFENALAKCTGANHQESQSSQVQPYLDILCTQAEILLLQDNAEDAQALLDLLPMNETDYPRVLAIQSQLAAVQSNIDLSSSYLNNAIDNYTKEWEKDQNNSLHNSFRRLQILLSIAEAALRLQEFSKALNLYSRSEDIFDNQPIQNWRFAVALIKAAEAQQKASLLRIKTHAPGENMLSAENYDLCQTLIEKATPFLPEDLGICLKAQCVASFTGTWPSCLHIEPCLSTPEDAALVVMNCDDEEIIQTIMDTYPDNLQVCQAYGLHAMRYGKDDVSVIVNKALQNDVSNPINHVLLTFLNIENPETAVKSLETAISFWQDEPEWHALAGDLYQQIGDTTSASRHIESALDTDPENADYWRKNADIRIKTNQLQEAKEALEKSASLQSTDPIVWTKMADVNRRLGNASEAIQNIEKASELAPNDKDVAFQEINYLIEQKRFVDAEKKADEILKKDELNQEAQILLARARAEQGKFDLALESLKAYADVNPDNTRVLLETIKTKKDRDGVEVVLPELINLAHGHPEDPDILTTLTDYLIQTNRLQEAEEAAQTILRILPEQAEVHLMLGRLQRMKGQLDQAIAHLSDAIRFNPHLVEAYLELGKTYQERRDLEQAIIVFQKGSEANKSDPRPYYHAGMALKDCKDYAGAETMLKQAKKYAPDDPLIVRQLGVITALNLVNNLREMR